MSFALLCSPVAVVLGQWLENIPRGFICFHFCRLEGCVREFVAAAILRPEVWSGI